MKKEAKKKTPQNDGHVWDVVVIGGGPAGMIAAVTAGERGRSVLLLEKNEKLGKKLLISGGGRCNVTNNKEENRTMLAKYKEGGKFLFSTFAIRVFLFSTFFSVFCDFFAVLGINLSKN